MAKKRKERPRAATAEQMPSPAANTVSKIHKESKANAFSILPAPPLSRLYAYVIDWILGGIVSGLPAVLVYLALTHNNAMLPDLYVFEAMGYPWSVGIVVGLSCVLAAIAYFVLIPLLAWPGQTPGKRIAHVRVATLDGGLPSIGRLIWRQVIVGFLLEGSGYVVSLYIRETMVLVTRVDVNYYWEIAGMIITAVSLLMFLIVPARRCVHDCLAGTRVVPTEGHPLYQD